MPSEKLIEYVKELARQHNELEGFVRELDQRLADMDRAATLRHNKLADRVAELESSVAGTGGGREDAPQPFLREADVRRILWQTGRAATAGNGGD